MGRLEICKASTVTYTANVLTIQTTGTGNCGVPAGTYNLIKMPFRFGLLYLLEHNLMIFKVRSDLHNGAEKSMKSRLRLIMVYSQKSEFEGSKKITEIDPAY